MVVSASSSEAGPRMVGNAGTVDEAEGGLVLGRLAVIELATKATSIGGLVGVVVCEHLAGLRIDLPGVAVWDSFRTCKRAPKVSFRSLPTSRTSCSYSSSV